jgi:hypothetical protein
MYLYWKELTFPIGERKDQLERVKCRTRFELFIKLGTNGKSRPPLCMSSQWELHDKNDPCQLKPLIRLKIRLSS